MADDLNPQSQQMADASMVRGLTAQAQAIWPQERDLLLQIPLPSDPEILDLGSGTGEFTYRVAALMPRAKVLGVELHAPHVELARERYQALGERLRFEVGDAFQLDLPDDAFDLVACRHMLQAVPHAERVLAEMKRVTRPGGWLHLLVEDYDMLHFYPRNKGVDDFFRRGAIALGESTGTDMRIGRRTAPELVKLGLTDIRVDYLTIDTLRVPGEALAAIFRAWQDGYAPSLVEATDLSREEVEAAFEDIYAATTGAGGYAVWHVPIVRGRVADS